MRATKGEITIMIQCASNCVHDLESSLATSGAIWKIIDFPLLVKRLTKPFPLERK